MLEIVTAYIEQHHLLPEQGTVVVAVSGGADSLCLLHLLLQLCGPGKHFPAVELHVAHLDHRLRGAASAQEAAAVAHLAHAWGLPCTIGRVDVPALAQTERRSIEDASRIARYRFLREVAQGRLIAVAHHRDDQVETLLLHLLRGGGIDAMIGLQPRQQDIIRPLLPISHADTAAYCRSHNLVPVEDLSNADPRFLRNRIRHELVPLLETLNAGIRETLVRNAEVMRVDAEWLAAQVDAHWPEVVADEQPLCIRLRLAPLLALPLSLQRHLLRRVTASLCDGQSPLELRHFELIEELLRRPGGGEELTLHLPQRLHLSRLGDTVLCKRVESHRAGQGYVRAGLVPALEVTLSVPGRVSVPGTSWCAVAEFVADETLQAAREALRAKDWARLWTILPPTRYVVYADGDITGDTLRVRTRRPGDRMRPLGMTHEKKVQDVLVDAHVPHAERASIPLFFGSSHCIWLAGIHLDDRARLTSRTERIVRLSIETRRDPL
ncbi:MAG TPA: tRNA lysidine(34) synthetase TilS [Ktedonosporobacter sp.]|jgi:tRNA(Ile)-lysidine synthase|nr:tRNA lysidine(34) synthetase TilS [Ktedonosporobacter sp.]